jgi:hypothetical protein
MPNKRKEGDDTPETPLLRRSARHSRNTPVSYSESHRNQPHPSVATATTPLVHSADQPPTPSPVMDQQQLKTIQESHEPNDVPPSSVGELESSIPVISESLKESVVDPNITSVTQLNMGFATLFLHATITTIADTNTGKERLWVMFSGIRTNAHDINFDRIMNGTVDRLVITRQCMSLIFYEEATADGVVLTDMIDGTKVVPNFLASPITLERIAHMRLVREQVF